jgi:hypothetical protein
MSFADHIILWLHITAAVFTIGPGTAAIMSTPRYIRKRNTVVVGYLYRTTRIYVFAALLTLVFGLVAAAQLHEFSDWWISVSLTLFVVAFILLVLIMRDQGKALQALARAEVEGGRPGEDTVRSVESEPAPAAAQAAGDVQPAAPSPAAADLRLAAVERGRIVSMGGLTALIWLVILVLMVWNGS